MGLGPGLREADALNETRNPTWQLNIAEMLEAMGRRELNPVDLVEELLDRIDRLDHAVGAWVIVDRDGAQEAAHEAARQWETGTAGPLCGVPVGLKDNIFVAGMPTRAAFRPYRNLDPGFDATTVSKLRAAGAIILGKLETTQLAGGDPAPTRNPHDLARTPGGSSSGSAAAVASGMVPLALGSQTGGSTNRPAAYCGVTGFAPTYGRISRFGLIPRSYSFDMVGILVKCVDDARRTYSVLAGRDAADTSTHHAHGDAAPVSRRPPTLLVVNDFMQDADPGVSDQAEKSIETFRQAGATIGYVDLPVPFQLMHAIQTVILYAEIAESRIESYKEHPAEYGGYLASQIEAGETVTAATYVRAQRLRTQVRAALERLLPPDCALVMPTAPVLPPIWEDGIGPQTHSLPWTVLGWPAITIPVGANPEGLPFAMQLVGRAFADSTLLGMAEWAEAHSDPRPVPMVADLDGTVQVQEKATVSDGKR